MPGASTQCVAAAVDTGWWPMSSLPGAVTWSAAEGSVTTDGTFTAPQKAGVYTVTAESGGVKGSTNITVLQPTAIYVTNQATKKNVSTLTLAPGQSVDLAAAAAYRSVGLTGSDRCFTWTADEAIGTITQDGKFTAGPNTATGKIKVSSGSYAVTIAVSVSAPTRYTLLDGFEGTTPGFTAKGGTVTLDTAQVKYGKQSLKLAYQDGASVALSSPRTLAETDRYVSLWVYGDQSGSIVSAAFAYADGTPVTQSLTTLSFSGWKQVTAAVPENAKTFTGFSVAASKHGTTWLDQVVFSNEAQWDSTAPSVDLTVRGQAVTATTLDDISGSLTAKQISLTLDGQPVDFTWKANGTLSATLPALGTSSHQVSLTVSDACGNLARKSVTISGTAATRFADMQKHWASTYTTPLNDKGIISGVTANGKTNFLPDQKITRGDFALMTANWLGLDLSRYAGVSLPYADAASIPKWDENAVKALYAEGIMQGSKAGDGSLRANAKASITRAEAMTILGRILPQGYPQASLTGFSDAASVPSWSKDYVATLVELKVVGGSNGKLDPNASVTRAEVAKMLFTLW